MKYILSIIFALMVAGAIDAQTTATTTKKTCSAVTKAGSNCKNTARPNTTYCRIHDSATPKCGTLTAKGTPCQIATKVAGEKCYRHKQKR